MGGTETVDSISKSLNASIALTVMFLSKTMFFQLR